MSNLSKEHFKEIPPGDTVKRLIAILESMSIEVEEQWLKKSSINTYALRVVFKGTNIGANGKGITKDFARASAYAELFERFQNNLFGYCVDVSSEHFPFFHSFDERFLSSKEIVEENSSYIQKYFEQRNMVSSSREEKIKAFQSAQHMDEQFYGRKDAYLCVPFYSFMQDSIVYLPKNVYRLAYGSNGMSAGNSFYEAFVQGVSEIFERYIQRKVIYEKIATPVIPDSALAPYPHLMNRISAIRLNPNYYCELRDCSLGGNFPVIALIIVEKDTGNFGIKFGSHPDFSIAVERSITEATQGQDIYDYSHRSTFDFNNKHVYDEVNTYNLYKMGAGQYPYEVLSKNSRYNFVPFQDVSEKSNFEISIDLLRKIRALGYDVLIRDVSYLGFSSMHIIIPGMSEMANANDYKYRAYQTKSYIVEQLKQPSKLSLDDYKYLIATIQYFQTSVLENNIESFYVWYDRNDFPFSNYNCGLWYLAAMASYSCMEYDICIKYLSKIIAVYRNNEPNSNNTKKLMILRIFCTGMKALSDETTVCNQMRPLLSTEVFQWLQKTFCVRTLVISNQYPCMSKETYPVTSCSAIYKKIFEKLFEKQLSTPIYQSYIPQYFYKRR